MNRACHLNACDLLIVGAGPAGMAAAIEAREAGLTVIVADEGLAPGGQIYRNVSASGGSSRDYLGAEYHEGRDLVERFILCDAVYSAQTTVFMIEKDASGLFTVGLAQGDRTTRLVEARRVLIATGAQERPFPIPGWTLPGVMTAGAAQTLLKASGIVPGGPVVLAGTGPLLMLLAAQYVRAGVPVSAILETTPKRRMMSALPHLPAFLLSRYAWKGLGLSREVLRTTPVYWGVTALKAEGAGKLEAVRFVHRGAARRLPAETLLLHQGVVPQINLAMSVGAKHVWSGRRLAFEPVLSCDFETSVEGLFIAGDSGGIGGADAAEQSGLLAALAVMKSLGIRRPDARAKEAETRVSLSRALRGRGFLDRLYRPADENRLPADDVMICRCEEIRAGDIRALARRGAQGPNQAKAFSRAGMGPCQGRLCGLTVSEIMAETLDKTPDDIGHLRIRAPVKPITVGQMAGLTKPTKTP